MVVVQGKTHHSAEMLSRFWHLARMGKPVNVITDGETSSV